MSLLVSKIISPIAELFPDLQLSYYVSRDGDETAYECMVLLRFLTTFTIWIPIFKSLKLISFNAAAVAVSLILTSFIMQSLYYNNSISGKLYMLGFTIIYFFTKSLYIPTTLIGWGLIGYGRERELYIDILGRILFSGGFIGFVNSL